MTFAVIAGILAAAFTGCPNPTGDDGTDTYTVTFNADGGTPVPAAQAVEAGGRAAEPPAMTRDGYSFGDWYQEAALITLWNFDADTVTGNITLYAKWNVTDSNQWAVVWNLNGGAWPGAAPAAQVEKGGTLTRPADPAKEGGYNFSGWYSDSGLTVAWDFTDAVTADLTLCAKWTDIFTTPADYRAMVSLIGGTITGDTVYNAGGSDNLFPMGRMVSLSPFKIARYETTYELWYEVYQWAAGNGYSIAYAGGEGDDGTEGVVPTEAAKREPVTAITWRDVIVWCNAYSEMSGKEPVYYTDAGYMARY